MEEGGVQEYAVLVEEAMALAVEEEEGVAVDQDEAEAEAVPRSRCNILHSSSRHSFLSLTKRPWRLKLGCKLRQNSDRSSSQN
jgi:hypothetical protein